MNYLQVEVLPEGGKEGASGRLAYIKLGLLIQAPVMTPKLTLHPVFMVCLVS